MRAGFWWGDLMEKDNLEDLEVSVRIRLKWILEETVRERSDWINPLTPNDPFNGRTAPLTSKRCILYIYSTNIGTEYFKRGIYSPFFSLQNALCFIILTYLVPVLFIFHIQGVLKLKLEDLEVSVRIRLKWILEK